MILNSDAQLFHHRFHGGSEKSANGNASELTWPSASQKVFIGAGVELSILRCILPLRFGRSYNGQAKWTIFSLVDLIDLDGRKALLTAERYNDGKHRASVGNNKSCNGRIRLSPTVKLKCEIPDGKGRVT